MRNIILILLSLLFVAGCSIEPEQKSVTYIITGLAMPYRLVYMNELGESVPQNIEPINDDEVWTYSFNGKQGDMLYLFAEFIDPDLVPEKFKFRILLNGKIYAESYGYDKSIGDSIFRVRRGGVIPF